LIIPKYGQWFWNFWDSGEAILKFTIFYNRVFPPLAVKELFTFHFNFVWGLATRYGLSVAVENRDWLGFPTATTCCLAEDAGASEGICIKFTI
jgi:hypothetical protein